MNIRLTVPSAGVALLAAAIALGQASAQPAAIEQFVRQVYIHGVPYEQAARFAPSDVPVLLRMLANREEEAHWPNIVVTIGMIGDEKAIAPLVEFFADGEGKLSAQHYAAKTSVLFALGYLANRTGSDRALDYLIAGVDPNAGRARQIAWRAPYQASDDDRDEQLRTLSIIGLGLSGQARARDVLLRLDSPADVVATALRDHQRIAGEGLRNYYRRNRGPQSDPPDLITGSMEPPPVVTGRRAAPSLPGPAGEVPALPPTPQSSVAPEIPAPALAAPPAIAGAEFGRRAAPETTLADPEQRVAQ